MPLLIRTPVMMHGTHCLMFVNDMSTGRTTLNDALGYIHSVEQAKISVEALISTAIAERCGIEEHLKFPICSPASWSYLIPFGGGRQFVVSRKVDHVGNNVDLVIGELFASNGTNTCEVTTHLREALDEHSIRYTTVFGIGNDSHAVMRSFEIGYSPALVERYDRTGTALKNAKALMYENALADMNGNVVGGIQKSDSLAMMLKRLTCFNPSDVHELLTPSEFDVIISQALSLEDENLFDDVLSRALRAFSLDEDHIDPDTTLVYAYVDPVSPGVTGFLEAALTRLNPVDEFDPAVPTDGHQQD